MNMLVCVTAINTGIPSAVLVLPNLQLLVHSNHSLFTFQTQIANTVTVYSSAGMWT